MFRLKLIYDFIRTWIFKKPKPSNYINTITPIEEKEEHINFFGIDHKGEQWNTENNFDNWYWLNPRSNYWARCTSEKHFKWCIQEGFETKQFKSNRFFILNTELNINLFVEK